MKTEWPSRGWRLPLMCCVLSLSAVQGCSLDLADDSLTSNNRWANVRVDGLVVGHPQDVSGQAIACERETDGGPVAWISDEERWMASPSEWLILGYNVRGERSRLLAGIKTHLRLGLPTATGGTSVELVMGDGVYRSDETTEATVTAHPGNTGTYRVSTGAKVRIDGLVGGRIVFRGVPLVSGEPFRGKQRLNKVVVEWDCLGRADIWGAQRRRMAE